MLIVGIIALFSGLTLYNFITNDSNTQNIVDETLVASSNMLDSVSPTDTVTVTVYDKEGNLKNQVTNHNIITSNGAIWFCIEQNRCTSQITGSTPAVPNVSGPTWWVQFISGTPNANEPTAADCTSPSGGGAITGQVTAGRCVTNFGAAPAQYQASGSIITVSLTTGTAQLRTTAGTLDTTNNFVQTTRATVCSIVNNGAAPSSGTCQFSETTPVFTNLSGSTITVNGLALSSGTASNTAAGPLIIAEATIPAVTLAAGDTISVTWTVIV